MWRARRWNRVCCLQGCLPCARRRSSGASVRALAPRLGSGRLRRKRDGSRMRRRWVRDSARGQSTVSGAVGAKQRKGGAEGEERPAGRRIAGGLHRQGAEMDSFGDHGIAMALAVAALRAEGETTIHGADGAGVSYPTFFEELEK